VEVSDMSYQAGLNAHGSNVPYFDRKADALKAAKDAARKNPGKLAALYETGEPTRLFRADEKGHVREVSKC
jgi:hypothetical protein